MFIIVFVFYRKKSKVWTDIMGFDTYILILTWLNALLGIYAAFTNAKGKKTAFLMWIIMDTFNILIYFYYHIWAKLTTTLVYLAIAIYGYIKNRPNHD